MATFIIVSGIVFWALVALVVGPKVWSRISSRPPIRRWLHSPRVYPYKWWLRYRWRGFLLVTLTKLRVVSPKRVPDEVVQAHRMTRLKPMKELRDALEVVDKLPTIQKGKEALGLKPVFDMPSKQVRLTSSPYTHPLQYPPYFLPGVPARTFYDPAEFPWAKLLEEAYPVIKNELLRVLGDDGCGFKAYMSEGQQRLAGVKPIPS